MNPRPAAVPMRPSVPWPARHARRQGFTLVEVLVALVIMAVIAGLGWRAIAGMVATRDSAQVASERMLQLQSVMAQWEADLDAGVATFGSAVPMEFSGARFMLTRRVEGGVQVVAWQLYGQRWQRWASPTVVRNGDINDQWLRAQQLLGTEAGQVLMLDEVTGWRMYGYANGSWANFQSSTGSDAYTLPQAMTIELDFGGPERSGTLVRDLKIQ